MSIRTLVGLAVIAAVVMYIIHLYNTLVSLRNQVKNAFSQIDVQLQRRHDLIPNLVESAKAYLSHERETLSRVTEARNAAVSAQAAAAADPSDGKKVQRLGTAETLLNRALANFYSVTEAYPDLKADSTVSQLMEELTTTENRLAFARQAFNDNVMTYNTFREQFPNNFVAGFFSFKESALLELENPDARQSPTPAS